jgi:hypothetical protein
MRSIMHKPIFLTALLFLIISVNTSFAQDENYQQEMEKAWTEYMTPGPMHEILAEGTGEWTSDIKMWMDPTQPPTESKGTSVVKSILGGRYFEGVHTSSWSGMEMNGRDLTGYDNAKQKFFNTWIDNFGTGIMYLEGTYDKGTKTFTYTGTSIDPLSKKDVPVKQIIKIIDDDHQYMEMYMTENGQEFKTMEINFTRKK